MQGIAVQSGYRILNEEEGEMTEKVKREYCHCCSRPASTSLH